MQNCLCLAALLIAICSCSLAPLSSTKTARSLGAGGWEVSAGLSPVPAFSLGRGITENLDFGLLMETQFRFLGALWAKYAFRSTDDGFSISLYGGPLLFAKSLAKLRPFLGPCDEF